MRRLVVLVAVAACGKSGSGTGTGTGTGTGAGTGTGTGFVAAPEDASMTDEPRLAPAAPVPAVPLGLPPVELPPFVTPENVALGEALFFDKRIGRNAMGACSDCHEPRFGWADDKPRSTTLAAKPNLRHTPALVNLAWVPELGWDGRYARIADAVRAHWKGQLDVDPAAGLAAIAELPFYRAHFRRAAGGAPTLEAAVDALAAFAVTRYQGDAPFDRFERGDRAAAPADAEKGYVLFTGKGQCGTCHVPPLYTDHAYHRILDDPNDEGRGRVDPAAAGAFRTPTLRGAALHPPYLHDGSAATLDAAIDAHREVALTPAERAQLVAFVRSLSPAVAPEHPAPELP